LACIENDDSKYGYINKSGVVIIEPQFDRAYSFSCGLACVERDGKNYYINKNGKLVNDHTYDSSGDYKNGTL